MQVSCNAKVKSINGVRMRLIVVVEFTGYRHSSSAATSQTAFFNSQDALMARITRAKIPKDKTEELEHAISLALTVWNEFRTVQDVLMDADQLSLLGFNVLAASWHQRAPESGPSQQM